jgi:hypothetical protein
VKELPRICRLGAAPGLLDHALIEVARSAAIPDLRCVLSVDCDTGRERQNVVAGSTRIVCINEVSIAAVNADIDRDIADGLGVVEVQDAVRIVDVDGARPQPDEPTTVAPLAS